MPRETQREAEFESLVARNAWVRRLARRLVRDEAAAEDVVQDTWVAALEHAPGEPAGRSGPPGGDEGRLRPWLARVATNFARQARRGEANRALREARRAREDRAPSAADTAERLEAQRALVEALQELAEPYRTTVTLRYLDGLSCARIARRQGIPAGTVRWRLKRGLDDLRRRLEDRSVGGDRGGRGSWCLALVPLLRRPPLAETIAAAASAAVQGGLAMHAMTKVGIAAAVVLTASVGVWVAVDVPGAGPVAATAPEPPAEVAPVRSAATSEEEPELAVAPVVDRRAAASAEPAAVTMSPRVPFVRGARLDARFVDEQGRPIEGVSLRLTSFDDLEPVESDRDGHAAVEVESPRPSFPVDYRASGTGYATHFGKVVLEEGRTTFLGDVELGPGGSLAGVVHGPDGRPPKSAEVIVTSPEIDVDSEGSGTRGPSVGDDVPRCAVASDGAFRIDGVRAGLARVWAGAEGCRWTHSEPVLVPTGSVREGVEIRLAPLEREDTIEGIVLSPEGDPVPRADVRYTVRAGGGSWSGSFESDAKGRFRHRVPVRGAHDLQARDPKNRWPDVRLAGVEPGARDISLQFPPARWLELTVRGGDSEPLGEYAAAVMSADGSRTLVPGTMSARPGGKARLQVPGEAFRVEVRARGHGSAELGPFEPDRAPAEATCRLQRRPGVRGRVLADGAGVGGATVRLYEATRPNARIESNGFTTRFHPTPEDSATTDGEGWFELDPERAKSEEGFRFFQRDRGEVATFGILVEADGWARGEVSPLEIDPLVGLDGVLVALGRGGAIEGRVRTAPGRDPAGVVVAIDRGDGRPRTQRVGPEGTFRFDRLTPGRWNVVRVDEEIREGSVSTLWSSGDGVEARFPWNCSVVEGSTTRHDVDLTDDRPCVLSARVLVGGAPAESWIAVMRPEEGSTGKTHPGGAVDAGGELRLETPYPGAWQLELSPPPGAGANARYTMPVELVRGDNPLRLDFDVGGIRGSFAVAGPGEFANFEAESSSVPGLRCESSARPDAEGRFEIPFLLAGAGRMSMLRTIEAGWVTGTGQHVEVDVPPGGWAEVTLP